MSRNTTPARLRAPLAFYPDWVTVPGLFVDGPGLYFGLGFGIGIFGGYGWDGITGEPTGITTASSTTTHRTFRAARLSGATVDLVGLVIRAASLMVVVLPGFIRVDLRGAGGLHSGSIPGRGVYGAHSGAFSGFNHGGMTQGFAARGRASAGGFHGGGLGLPRRWGSQVIRPQCLRAHACVARAIPRGLPGSTASRLGCDRRKHHADFDEHV